MNKDFSKETLAYRKELWEKVKALRKEDKIAYLNCLLEVALALRQLNPVHKKGP